ncbi:hypothetical protein BH23PLA1_BH23PLA1_07550 [soil metagenome]
MSGELIWPIVCLIIGLFLLMAEVFVPSGGLLGLLAAGFLLVSLWLAFSFSTTMGLNFLLALGLLLPLAVVLAVQIWPRTPMGRWIILKPPTPEDLEPAPGPSHGGRLEHLIGQYGRSLTPLRPSGVIDFDGRRLDGLSEGGMIPPGALVKAVQVRSGQIVVRLAPEQTLNELLADPNVT